jgi:hypothetical protein
MVRKFRPTAPTSSSQQSPSCVLRPDTGSLLLASTRRESSARRCLFLPLDPNPLLHDAPSTASRHPREGPKNMCIFGQRGSKQGRATGESRGTGAGRNLVRRCCASALVESASAWEDSRRRVRSALEASVVGSKAVGVRDAVDSLLMHLEEEGRRVGTAGRGEAGDGRGELGVRRGRLP